MNVGRLLLRVTVGTIFVEHGTQKLFGWFGGHGLDGTGQFFESVGLRPGRRHALAAGTAETSGGILLALGLATPLAAAELASVMVTALRTAIWRGGIKTGTGGYEMLLLASALALAESGPGDWSVDAAAGTERTGLRWAAAALAVAAVGSTVAITLGRRYAPPPADDTAASPEGDGAAAPVDQGTAAAGRDQR
jgi:putative oxidoreductase